MKNIITLCICLIALFAHANELNKLKNKLIPLELFETDPDSLDFKIFPNPLKNHRLFIESNGSGEKHIEIYNVLGEKKIEIHTYEDAILLSELETGIYVFYLKQDGKKGYKRLVIH
jgi:hypothetical protein